MIPVKRQPETWLMSIPPLSLRDVSEMILLYARHRRQRLRRPSPRCEHWRNGSAERLHRGSHPRNLVGGHERPEDLLRD
nr:hypothetical protein CFP56_02480 [Quercus suber]